MWMPQFPLTLVSARNATATHPAFAIFRTSPKMTKHEIKEYLTKIYDLPIKKVNTMNYLGKSVFVTVVVFKRNTATVLFDDVGAATSTVGCHTHQMYIVTLLYTN
jgi:ribosomal protein L23